MASGKDSQIFIIKSLSSTIIYVLSEKNLSFGGMLGDVFHLHSTTPVSRWTCSWLMFSWRGEHPLCYYDGWFHQKIDFYGRGKIPPALKGWSFQSKRTWELVARDACLRYDFWSLEVFLKMKESLFFSERSDKKWKFAG